MAAHQAPIPGILQARILEWAAISFSSAWKWKVKVKSLSRVQLLATPRSVAYQAPPSMGYFRQEYWSGVPYLYLEFIKFPVEKAESPIQFFPNTLPSFLIADLSTKRHFLWYSRSVCRHQWVFALEGIHGKWWRLNNPHQSQPLVSVPLCVRRVPCCHISPVFGLSYPWIFLFHEPTNSLFLFLPLWAEFFATCY